MGKRLWVTMMVVAFLGAACSQSATSLATRPASEPTTASTPRPTPSGTPSPLSSAEGTPTALMSATNTPAPASVEAPPTDTPAPTTPPAGPLMSPTNTPAPGSVETPATGTPAPTTTPTTTGVSITDNCHTAWFFADEMHTHGCPQEAIRSYAAAQYFEAGAMLWIAQLGRYFILEETLLYQGDVRKRAHYVQDPLNIMRDTSAEVRPPEGLYAPESGFGLVWRGDVSNSPGYRESLGWAVAREFGYEAVYQCDPGQVTGGRFWQRCYLTTPDNKVVFLHPLGGWYTLGEQ
jgi:hypothetical protein